MRLLILGTGGMANQHAANFKAIEGVSVVGGVDVVPERLAAFCTEHGIANHFTTLEDALAWGEFDAVANVTPDRIHPRRRFRPLPPASTSSAKSRSPPMPSRPWR